MRSLASIYGIDISAGNIDQSRARMRSLIASHLECHRAGRNASRGFANAVEAILETNIVHADTVADTAKIDLVEYRPVNRGMFIREWSRLDPAANEPNLFSSSLRSDEAPIHYSMLRATPEPLGLREAA